MWRAERITPSIAHHGEGPFWDLRHNRLLLLDVYAGDVVAIGSEGPAERIILPANIATVVRHREGGGYVFATERSILAANDELDVFEVIADLPESLAIRTNDGGCDPLGAFVIGTMSDAGESGAGSVYRITPQYEVQCILGDVSISNGMQWSADGLLVYYIDTPTRNVAVFDVDPDSGSWSNRRLHIEMNTARGVPDGMTIDEEGGLWVALWGGGTVNHYDIDGQLVEAIQVPGVSNVSSCAFGGPDFRNLYITTSRQGLIAGSEPDAGAVFMIETSTRGLPQREFGG